MKHLKKLSALLIALVMVLSMGVMAFADNTPIETPDGGFEVIVNPHETDEGTHSYEAYQIFTGDLAVDEEGNKILSNIAWGNGITHDAAFAAAIEALRSGKDAEGYVPLTASSTATQFAEAIAALNADDDDATAQAVAAAIGAALISANAIEGTATGVEGLDPGYYLIKDAVAPTAPDDDHNSGAHTRYIVQVVDNVEITEKASVPSVVKKVKDTNDSKPATAAGNADDYDADGMKLKDSADYDIGDAVPFQITATTASTAADYIKYHVTIMDDQSAGLDAPESFSIAVLTGDPLTVNNTANATATKTVGKIRVTATVVAAGADFQIKVTFENIDNIDKAATAPFVKLGTAVNSQAIVVSYTSVLNEDAEFGATGNPNEVYLKYSNNPNSTDDSDTDEGETPKDRVIVFTYKPVVNKVDENGDPLEGAGFTLYKEVADAETEGAEAGSAIKAALAQENPSINAVALEDAKYYITLEMEPDQAGTTFTYEGIDDGTYVLVETTIPTGYNAYVAQKFDVTAEHDEEADDPALTELEGGDVLTGVIDENTDKLTGELQGEIENKSGSVLPSTGGIGRRIFIVSGSILLVGAAILLITRRRMSAR